MYAGVVVEDVERHHLELEERQMAYDGGCADRVSAGIGEASFVVVPRIHGEKGGIHHHHRHHRPSPSLCLNNQQVLCVRWRPHTIIFDVSLKFLRQTRLNTYVLISCHNLSNITTRIFI